MGAHPDPTDTLDPAVASDDHAVSGTLRWKLLAGGLGVSVSIYSVVNLWMASRQPTRVLPTFVDDLVPFYAPSVAIYLGIYALAVAPICIIIDKRAVYRGAAAYATLLLAGVPFWILWPVTVPRSAVPVHDLWTWGVAVTRWVDPPANCFPSMHVAETVLAALICTRLDRLVGVVVGVLAALVWWSTMALGQHWFIDGLAGALLAVAAYLVWFRWLPLPADACRARSRWYLLWAVLLYAVQFVVAAAPWWSGLATPEDIGAVSGVG